MVCIRKVKGLQDGQTPGMPVPEFLKVYQLQVRGCFWEYSILIAWTLLIYFEPASWQVTDTKAESILSVSQPHFEMRGAARSQVFEEDLCLRCHTQRNNRNLGDPEENDI